MKILLAIITAILGFVIPFVLADTVSSSASVTNAAPTVGTVTPTDPITLSESTTVAVQCNATITDNNGYADVTTVNGTLLDTAATTESAANDFNNKFTNTSCTLSGGSGTTTNAVCGFSVHYSANAAEWTCKLTAKDNSSATGSANATNVTVNQLKALATDGTLAFGSLALGATSGEKNITANNTGNVQIDISLDGYGSTDGDGLAMSCGLGNVSLSNLRYNLTSGTAFANMTNLTDTAVTLSTFDLNAESTDNTASSKNAFWLLQIPSTLAGGSCTGNVIVTAV